MIYNKVVKNMKLKALAVFGTRPEAIKMAPLIKVLNESKEIGCKVAVTAQHREMLDQVLSLFNIKPEYDLNIMEENQTLSDITVKALKVHRKIIIRKPDIILFMVIQRQHLLQHSIIYRDDGDM